MSPSSMRNPDVGGEPIRIIVEGSGNVGDGDARKDPLETAEILLARCEDELRRIVELTSLIDERIRCLDESIQAAREILGIGGDER